MNNRQLYEVLTRSYDGRIYRYMFLAEPIEYWGMPSAQEKLGKLFKEAALIDDEILEIRDTDFVSVVSQK